MKENIRNENRDLSNTVNLMIENEKRANIDFEKLKMEKGSLEVKFSEMLERERNKQERLKQIFSILKTVKWHREKNSERDRDFLFFSLNYLSLPLFPL